MFPAFNFWVPRAHPTRRTKVDAFGKVGPVASSASFPALGLAEDQIITQRIWQPTTFLPNDSVKKIFKNEPEGIDRLADFVRKNDRVKEAVASLRSYRILVKSRPAMKEQCQNALERGITSKERRFQAKEGDRGGIIIDGKLTSRWMLNLPLEDPDLFEHKYAIADADYVGGGALGVGRVPDNGEIVVCYPDPKTRNVLRVVNLSSSLTSEEKESWTCTSHRRAVLLKCDPVEVHVNDGATRVAVRGDNYLHVLDIKDQNKSPRPKASLSCMNHNFREPFSCFEFNSWNEAEGLISTKDSDVRLWDLENGSLQRACTGEWRFADPLPTVDSQVQFGSHPRLALHCNETGVFLWDLRSRTSTDLFALPHPTLTSSERVYRVLKSNLCHQSRYVITTRSILVVDERMPNVPVLRTGHAQSKRPQYAVVAKNGDCDEMVVTACQLPWELTGVSMHKTSPIWPFQMNQCAIKVPAPNDDQQNLFQLLPRSNSLGLLGLASSEGRIWQLSAKSELYTLDLNEKETDKRDKISVETDLSLRISDSTFEPDGIRDLSDLWLEMKRSEKVWDTDVCELCKSKTSVQQRDFFDEDEIEDYPECALCGIDKSFISRLSDARRTVTVIKPVRDPEPTEDEVDAIFRRMTLREAAEPEGKVFSLTSENLATFTKRERESRPPTFPHSEVDADDIASSLETFFLESDLFCAHSQDSSVSGSSSVPNSPFSARKRRLCGSPGFGSMPERAKKRLARKMWNPFFVERDLQNIRLRAEIVKQKIAAEQSLGTVPTSPEKVVDNSALDGLATSDNSQVVDNSTVDILATLDNSKVVNKSSLDVFATAEQEDITQEFSEFTEILVDQDNRNHREKRWTHVRDKCFDEDHVTLSKTVSFKMPETPEKSQKTNNSSQSQTDRNNKLKRLKRARLSLGF